MLRAAAGVTQRANSVWPREPGTRPPRAARRAPGGRLWYRNRRLPLIFQVFDDPRYAPLNAVLDAEGFTRQSETLVLVRDGGADARGGLTPASRLSAEPSAEWLRLWWSVDGRGDDTALATARGILSGCPSLYALVRDDDGRPAAVGRLAVPPGGRRRGRLGRAVLHGHPPGCPAPRPCRPDPAGPAARRRRTGLGSYWLLVTAANAGARELYARAGFQEAGRYLYRQERPKRHLTGC